jgi:hypothetical protein
MESAEEWNSRVQESVEMAESGMSSYNPFDAIEI